MPRSVNSVASRARRKKVLKKAKGYFGRRKNVWTVAKNAVEKGLSYAYRDRKNKKRTFRALWITRINAGARLHGLSYSELMGKLKEKKIPSIVFRSKSGGAHSFIFTKVKVPAIVMREKLKMIASAMGHAKAEIFPKQDYIRVDRGDTGSFLNLPYHGNGKTVRYAFNDEGEPVAEKEVKTAGKPYKIVLSPDKRTIKSNGKDLSFVEVSVVDKNGNPCPTATNQLKFKVKGAGSFRAACNGDATSLELFHLPTMKLFSGKLVVLVQSTDDAGSIDLQVIGKGLKSGKLKLNSTEF